MTPLGGVGGGTNPAGETRVVVTNAEWLEHQELRREVPALRAVVEGLRTQLRESHEDYARLLSRWDDEREAHAALQVRVDAVKALAEQWAALAPEDDWGETPGDTQQADLGRYLLRVLAGSVGVSDD